MHVYERGQHIKDNTWPWPFKLAILAAKFIAEKTIQYSYLTLKELFTILKRISVIGRDYALNYKKNIYSNDQQNLEIFCKNNRASKTVKTELGVLTNKDFVKNMTSKF